MEGASTALKKATPALEPGGCLSQIGQKSTVDWWLAGERSARAKQAAALAKACNAAHSDEVLVRSLGNGSQVLERLPVILKTRPVGAWPQASGDPNLGSQAKELSASSATQTTRTFGAP